jgi:C-terminal processing protease CtpA/Prc
MVLPSPDYRLLALFRVWNIIQFFYPYRNLMDENWSDALAAFIPRFESNESEFDYQKTVIALAKRIQDSHVGVYGAGAVDRYFGNSIPPVVVGSVEGETAVTGLIDAAAAAKAGIAVGDVVLAVDDEPIAQRRNRIEQFVIASTAQAMRLVVDVRLLRGAKDSLAKLRLRGADGAIRDVSLARTTSGGGPLPRTTPIWRRLPSGYGYIDLGRLQAPDADTALDALLDAPALIFDMRGYPSAAGFAIAPRLMQGDNPVAGAQLRRTLREGMQLQGDRAEAELVFTQWIEPSSKPRYRGKVVVLINEEAISRAEHVCLAIGAASDATFVGSPTMGANGDITSMVLPGGLTMSFTGQAIAWGDGRQLQRVGVKPQVPAAPTIAGIRAGRDEVLEAAENYLRAALGR